MLRTILLFTCQSRAIWKSQIEFFSKKYKVIAFDHRGHGKSDKPKGDYSIQTLSNDLHSLIQKLNLEKVTLVGHSLGGMTDIIFTLDNPDKVTKLVLVGSTAKISFSMRIFLWLMIHIFSYESFARGSVDYEYYEPSEQVIKEALDRTLKTPKPIAYECFKEFTKYDVRDRVSGIKIPTLIIVGEKESPVESKHLNRAIEGSKMKIIPNSKHMVMIDKSEKFNEILEEFIR